MNTQISIATAGTVTAGTGIKKTRGGS
jgi:hypothetical protein